MNYLSALIAAASAASTLLLAPVQAFSAEQGAVTIVLDKEPNSLDPCEVTYRAVGFVIRNNIIETVTRIDPLTSEVQPRLATSWSRVDDLTWQFKLRQNVVFHDGEPFNADAFVTSFNRTLDTDLACTTRLSYLKGMVLTPVKVDEYTVNIKTDKPQPLLPLVMSYVPISSPKTPPKQLTREPIGTGPYKFVEWQAGREIKTQANDNYWGGACPVKSATYLFREDSTVRAAMIANGEADLTPNIDAKDANDPSMDVSYLNSETQRIRFDMGKPPLNDIRVRQAVRYAIDRQSLLGTVYPKTWKLAINNVLPTISGANLDIKPYPYDPEKAKSLVQEAKAAGVPVDKQILMVISNRASEADKEAQTTYVQMLNAVGLNVKLQILEEAERRAKFSNAPFPPDQPVHFSVEDHDNNTGDAGITLLSKYHTGGGNSKLSDPQVDALIDRGLAADNPERAQIFREAFAKIDELVPDLILYHIATTTRVGPRIHYTPTTGTNSEVQLCDITFAE